MHNIITDNRITGALCRRLMKVINSKGEIYPHSQYKYIEFINVDDLSPVIFETIIYKGKSYRLKFFSGCFSPYFIELNV